MFHPAFDEFESVYSNGVAQVVWTRLVADLETPVSVYLKIAAEQPNSFLLESVEGGATRGRYSIIGLDPDAIWKAQGDTPSLNLNAEHDPSAFEVCGKGTLDALRDFIESAHIDLPEDLPPMSAGVFGYMGYDAVRLMEHLPNENPDALGLPDGLFLRPTMIAVFDSVKDEVILVTPVRPNEGTTAKMAYEKALDRLERTITRFDQALPHAEPEVDVTALPAPTSNTPKETYFDMVARAKEYIAAGDIFQAVLSQRFETDFELPPFSLYRALRRINPSPDRRHSP